MKERARESAFAKGAIFLTVTHRSPQIGDVAGGDGPLALLRLCRSWTECRLWLSILFSMTHFFLRKISTKPRSKEKSRLNPQLLSPMPVINRKSATCVFLTSPFSHDTVVISTQRVMFKNVYDLSPGFWKASHFKPFFRDNTVVQNTHYSQFIW